MSFTPGAGTRFLVSTGASGTPLSGPLSITGGTATANTPVLSATQTWNNAAVTFTGWQLNVTDTASNAASLLMDLQVGGISRISFGKGAQPAGGLIAFGATQALITANNSVGIQIKWANSFVNIDSTGVQINTSGATYLATDANNILAQRNGVNAQTLRVYNTFTDASNYERGIFSWVSNELQIATQAAGTGSARSLTLKSANNLFLEAATSREVRFYNGSSAISWFISGSSHLLAGLDNAYDIGATGASRPRNVFWAGYQEMSEMTAPAAPATNSVRIYAEDNGSGKTRLMALFATGAAQQIAIEP